MKYSDDHGVRTRKGKKKPVVANKKLFRRAVGFMLVLVILLAAFQTGVLATTGDASANTVVVGAQGGEVQPDGAVEAVEPAAPAAPSAELTQEAQEYTVTLFIESDQYMEPLTTEGGKIAEPSAPSADKVPEGKRFLGWYTEAEGGAKFDASQSVAEDMKLYAQFEDAVVENVPAAPEGAAAEEQAPAAQNAQLFVTLNIGESQYGEKIPVFDGHINLPDAPDSSAWPAGSSAFLGWYADAGLTTAFNAETIITENMNLYAKFAQAVHYVYFLDADNAVVKTLSAAPGEAVEEPNADDFITAPAGQKFLYWADNETGAQFDFTVPLTGDVTLRPVFSSLFYVYFYSEGTQVDPLLVQEGSAAAKPASNPTRDGYDFKYWSIEANGAEYDFASPVNGTLRLYAVWEAKTVNYTAVIWMEKANIAGDPSWPNDYTSFRVVKNGDRTKPDYVGNSIAKCEAVAGTEITEIDPSVLPYIVDTAFFNYAKTMPTTIQGNGQSVVNVLYDRNVYTMEFIVSHTASTSFKVLPDGTRVTKAYAPESALKWEWTEDSEASWKEKTFNREPMQQSVYSFDAKYEQDITKLWPSQNINAKLTAYDGVGNVTASQPDSWQPNGATMGSQSSMITKRITLTAELIPWGYGAEAPKSLAWHMVYVDRLETVEVNYWYDVLEGQTGVPAKGNAAAGSYVKDELLSQTLTNTLGSGVYGKELSGMKLAGSSQQTQPDGTKAYDFYYKRKLVNLQYNTFGGSSVPTVNDVKHGQDIGRYAPTDPTKANATFAGWYYDSAYKNPVDWENDAVISSGQSAQTVTLFAKWESTDQKVSFYDRQSSIGAGNAIAKQGVATGSYVDLSTPVSMTVEGEKYALIAGASVPGHGEFAGWYWLQGAERMPFSSDMPINKSYDLFAMWKVGNFHITYEGGEATSGTAPSEAGEYGLGTMYKVQGNTGGLSVSGSDKTFIGWKSSADGKVYYAGTMMEIQGDTTLVAQFAEKNNSYTVTYKPGYEGGQQEIVTYVKKGNATNLPSGTTFTRPGYEFAGWKASDGTVYEAGTKYTPAANETMTAQWTALHKVEFITDGGGTLKGQTVYENIKDGTTWSGAQIMVPEPEAGVGYYFRGWEPVIPGNGSKITADATYKATFWQKSRLTLEAASATRAYNGQPLTATGLKNANPRGLRAGDTIEVTMKADSVQTNVGSHVNEIAEARVYRMVNGAKTEVTNEYELAPFKAGLLTVEKMKVTVTADNAGKVYGNADPGSFTATAGATINGDSLAYTVTREAGEDVKAGGYKLTVNPTAGASENENYEIVPGEGVFTIAQRPITITANDAGKVFGTAADPELTASYTDLGTGVAPVYTLSREAGEDVKTYPITVTANVQSNPNYLITLKAGVFTIRATTAPIKITPNANTKVYGGAEPTLTATVAGLPAGQQLDYRLERETGDTVGTYKIKVVLGSNPNYANIDVSTTADFTITPKAATITVKGAERTYGDASAESFTADVSGTINTDVLDYKLEREKPGVKDVGTYKIDAVYDKEQVTNRNYDITVTKGDLKINPRQVTLKADDKSITYGDGEPTYTAQLTSGSLIGQDKLNYTFERTSGKDVKEGGYEIRVLPGSNPNYTVSAQPGTLTINKKTITVTPKDTDVIYGEALDLTGIDVMADGLIAGDTLNYEVVKADAENMNAGLYDLTVTDKGNPNYTIVSGTGTLTITPRPLTITPENNGKIFGQNDPNPLTTVTYGGMGLVNSDTIGYTLSRAAGSQVRLYDINVTVDKAAYPNYDITLGTGTFTIMPVTTQVMIIPQSAEMIYGEAEPELKATVIGANQGDLLNYTLHRTGTNEAGKYSVWVELGENPQYTNIGVQKAEFVIKARPVTVQADDKKMTYGTNPEPELTASVLTNEQDESSMGMVGQDKLTVNLNRTPGTEAGTYKISAVAEANKNYDVTVKEGKFVIEPKPIIVTAGDYTKTYGDPDPAFKASAAVLEPGDSLNVVLSREAGSTAGQEYAVRVKVVEDATAKNYAITTVDGKLTITKKQITATPLPTGKVYGDADPTEYAVSAPGLVGEDSLNYTVKRAEGENVGEYDLTLTPGENTNYEITPGTGAKFAISPRPVTLTADNAGKLYGGDDPELTVGVTQGNVVNGDALDYTVGRAAGEDSAEYPITITLGENKNYTVTAVDGTFTIAPQGIEALIIPDNTGKVYGGTDPTLSAKVIGTESMTGLAYTLERVAGENAGSYDINVTLAENPNYDLTAVQLGKGTFSITPKPATVTAANATKVAGTQDPTFTASVSGVNGNDTLNYTLGRAAGEDPGTYAINVTAGQNPNYAVSGTPGIFTITPVATIPTDPTVPGGTTTDPGTPDGGTPDDPGAPADPGTPDAPDAPVAAAPAPAAVTPDNVQLQTINPTDTPLAGGEAAAEQPTVQIGDKKVPLASNGITGSWALLNLILAFLTGIIMLALLFTYFFGKDEGENEERSEARMKRTEEEEAKRKLKRKGLGRLLSIVVTAVAIIVFVLTENITLPMVFIDGWTWLMAAMAAVQIIVAFFSRKSRKDSDDTDTEQPNPQVQNI